MKSHVTPSTVEDGIWENLNLCFAHDYSYVVLSKLSVLAVIKTLS